MNSTSAVPTSLPRRTVSNLLLAEPDGTEQRTEVSALHTDVEQETSPTITVGVARLEPKLSPVRVSEAPTAATGQLTGVREESTGAAHINESQPPLDQRY